MAQFSVNTHRIDPYKNFKFRVVWDNKPVAGLSKMSAVKRVSEVIEWREAGGPTISATYVWQLRKGIRDNPTKAHLEALAAFFGVAPSYFFDEESAERIEAELDLLAAMRDPAVRSIALRVSDLSTGSIRAILGMVEQARRMEGLTDDPVDGGDESINS